MHLPWLLIGLLGIWYSLFGVRNGFLHVWLNRKTTVTHMWVLRKKTRKTKNHDIRQHNKHGVPVRQSQWNGMPSALLRKKKNQGSNWSERLRDRPIMPLVFGPKIFNCPVKWNLSTNIYLHIFLTNYCQLPPLWTSWFMRQKHRITAKIYQKNQSVRIRS